MHDLRDGDGKAPDNLDEDIEAEEELELGRKSGQTSEGPVQEFATRSEVHDMVTTGVKTSPSHCSACNALFPGLVEDELICALQVGYGST